MVGLNTRYDGDDCHRPGLMEDLQEMCVVPVCPEQLGGLPTPRPPAELQGGDGRDVPGGDASVLTEDGTDVTDNYLRGARQARDLAQRFGIKRAYLMERSPSCGVNTIVRGGRELSGRGVTAAVLAEAGVEVVGIE